MTTERTDLQASIAARQAIDPRNLDDAEYIAAHPSEFDTATVREATTTLVNLHPSATLPDR